MALTKKENVNVVDIVNNIDKYDFVCNTAKITAHIEIHDKEDGNLILRAPLDLNITNGNINDEYGKKFFSDLAEEAKPAFVNQVKAMIEQKAKSKVNV